jgi:hypothetical protein
MRRYAAVALGRGLSSQWCFLCNRAGKAPGSASSHLVAAIGATSSLPVQLKFAARFFLFYLEIQNPLKSQKATVRMRQ